VYMATRHQYITAGQNNVPVDISIPAVKIVMDIYNVGDQRKCLESVRRLWHKTRGDE